MYAAVARSECRRLCLHGLTRLEAAWPRAAARRVRSALAEPWCGISLLPQTAPLALALVVWAASYGLNEAGEEIIELVDEDLQQRKERVNEMLLELLYLIDIHGILRKPTWDGVRALLLTMPLTEGVSPPPRDPVGIPYSSITSLLQMS